jgi:hypothetical protein
MSPLRLAVATYPFPSSSLSIRDLRVAALRLPAQFHEIFLSLPAAAGPDGALSNA